MNATGTTAAVSPADDAAVVRFFTPLGVTVAPALKAVSDAEDDVVVSCTSPPLASVAAEAVKVADIRLA
jgi:hypothetical protein